MTRQQEEKRGRGEEGKRRPGEKEKRRKGVAMTASRSAAEIPLRRGLFYFKPITNKNTIIFKLNKMERKEFCKKTGCGILGFSAIPLLANDASAPVQEQSPKRKQFKIDIEIFEARQDTWCHKKGDKFEYPKDMAHLQLAQINT